MQAKYQQTAYASCRDAMPWLGDLELKQENN
jgi:hypothetical protein